MTAIPPASVGILGAVSLLSAAVIAILLLRPLNLCLSAPSITLPWQKKLLSRSSFDFLSSRPASQPRQIPLVIKLSFLGLVGEVVGTVLVVAGEAQPVGQVKLSLLFLAVVIKPVLWTGLSIILFSNTIWKNRGRILVFSRPTTPVSIDSAFDSVASNSVFTVTTIVSTIVIATILILLSIFLPSPYASSAVTLAVSTLSVVAISGLIYNTVFRTCEGEKDGFAISAASFLGERNKWGLTGRIRGRSAKADGRWRSEQTLVDGVYENGGRRPPGWAETSSWLSSPSRSTSTLPSFDLSSIRPSSPFPHPTANSSQDFSTVICNNDTPLYQGSTGGGSWLSSPSQPPSTLISSFSYFSSDLNEDDTPHTSPCQPTATAARLILSRSPSPGRQASPAIVTIPFIQPLGHQPASPKNLRSLTTPLKRYSETLIEEEDEEQKSSVSLIGPDPFAFIPPKQHQHPQQQRQQPQSIYADTRFRASANSLSSSFDAPIGPPPAIPLPPLPTIARSLTSVKSSGQKWGGSSTTMFASSGRSNANKKEPSLRRDSWIKVEGASSLDLERGEEDQGLQRWMGSLNLLSGVGARGRSPRERSYIVGWVCSLAGVWTLWTLTLPAQFYQLLYPSRTSIPTSCAVILVAALTMSTPLALFVFFAFIKHTLPRSLPPMAASSGFIATDSDSRTAHLRNSDRPESILSLSDGPARPSTTPEWDSSAVASHPQPQQFVPRKLVLLSKPSRAVTPPSEDEKRRDVLRERWYPTANGKSQRFMTMRGGDSWLENGQARPASSMLSRAVSMLVPYPRLSQLPLPYAQDGFDHPRSAATAWFPHPRPPSVISLASSFGFNHSSPTEDEAEGNQQEKRRGLWTKLSCSSLKEARIMQAERVVRGSVDIISRPLVPTTSSLPPPVKPVAAPRVPEKDEKWKRKTFGMEAGVESGIEVKKEWEIDWLSAGLLPNLVPGIVLGKGIKVRRSSADGPQSFLGARQMLVFPFVTEGTVHKGHMKSVSNASTINNVSFGSIKFASTPRLKHRPSHRSYLSLPHITDPLSVTVTPSGRNLKTSTWGEDILSKFNLKQKASHETLNAGRASLKHQRTISDLLAGWRGSWIGGAELVSLEEEMVKETSPRSTRSQHSSKPGQDSIRSFTFQPSTPVIKPQLPSTKDEEMTDIVSFMAGVQKSFVDRPVPMWDSKDSQSGLDVALSPSQPITASLNEAESEEEQSSNRADDEVDDSADEEECSLTVESMETYMSTPTPSPLATSKGPSCRISALRNAGKMLPLSTELENGVSLGRNWDQKPSQSASSIIAIDNDRTRLFATFLNPQSTASTSAQASIFSSKRFQYQLKTPLAAVSLSHNHRNLSSQAITDAHVSSALQPTLSTSLPSSISTLKPLSFPFSTKARLSGTTDKENMNSMMQPGTTGTAVVNSNTRIASNEAFKSYAGHARGLSSVGGLSISTPHHTVKSTTPIR